MTMKLITKAELQEGVVRALGLQSTYELTSKEALAASLRRASGFLCPCPKATLIQAVLSPLEGLVDCGDLETSIEATLDELTGYGDLLEESEVVSSGRERGSAKLLYAAPPSFVWRGSRSALLVGIVPDLNSPLPRDVEARIEYKNHVRRITEAPGEDLAAYLEQLDLMRISEDRWMRSPKTESSTEHLHRFDRLLRPVISDWSGLTILNPMKSVRFYRARWEIAEHQTGRFIARRAQPYGNDLWCYVDLSGGHAKRVIDFPLPGSSLRGCDEAWRLQAAIDACRNEAQQYRVRTVHDSSQRIIDFFSPVPQWAQRRWDIIGSSEKPEHCLFSYRFPSTEIDEEISFIEETLWLRASTI
jgi:hypothetical protein